MTPDRWKRIESLYHAALELGQDGRSVFLAESCAGDDTLYREVASLIASHEQANTFIESSPDDVIAGMLADQHAQTMRGRVLGHYRIDSLLGAGGMGEVYRARDTRLDRDVAVKILPIHLAGDLDALRRFEREAKAIAALSHPNILSIFDFGFEQGLSYAVMELLEGETLRQRLERGPLNWRDAVEVGIVIASGLSAAHDRGVIHRDLKPENIFLTSDGQVKILDFGIARMKRAGEPNAKTLTSSRAQTTLPGLVMGTIGYMSPEQARGETVEATSDIFSFGCVLYETLCGRRPFARNTAAEVIAAILKEEPPPLLNYTIEVPARLDRAVSKALRKTPAERYHSAGEALDDLRNLRLESEVEDRLKRAGDQTATDLPGSITTPEPPVRTDGQKALDTQDEIISVVSSRARKMRMIALSFTAMIFLLGAMGAYRIWTRNQTLAGDAGAAQTREPGIETLRYYLELEPAQNAPSRSTGDEPIGERGFRFHFIARSSGYLYIIAPGENNMPMTLLTSKPIEASGVKTNFVEAGKDFRFPSGEGNGIAFGPTGNINTFTVIFSSIALVKPNFLASRAHRPLTANEQGEMASLWQRFGEHAPKSVVRTDSDGASVVIISPPDRASDQPIIFDIPLKRL